MKWLLFSIGWISFALGIIGAFLPILPTTPFLILSAYMFSKSSPRFHDWLLNLPMAGEAVKDWQNNRVIKTRAKILCCSMILLSLGLIWRHPNILAIIKVSVTMMLTSVGIFVTTRKSTYK